jgi:hypothetical protein
VHLATTSLGSKDVQDIWTDLSASIANES